MRLPGLFSFRTRITAAIGVLATLSIASQAVLLGDDVAWNDFPATFYFSGLMKGNDGSPMQINCSATLIHPRILVTAAHCLQHGGRADYVLNGSSIAGVNHFLAEHHAAPAWAGTTALAEKSAGHPRFNDRGATESTTSWDVGYIVLKEPVTNVEPAEVFLADTPAARASLNQADLVIAGYGSLSDATEADLYATLGTKRKGELRVLRTRPQFFQARGERQSPLEGDSGGSAYLERGGKHVLLGVISGEESTRDGRGGRPASLRTANFAFLTTEKLCWIEKETGIDLPQAQCGH